MKFMFIFLLAGTLSICASDIYSQNATIQISNYRDITIEQLIREVEAQTGYLFVYSKNEIDVNEHFSLPAEEVTVKSALDNLAASAKITYRYDNDYIILAKRDVVSNEPVVMQGIVITGRVTEADGVPLPGVTVAVKGTTQGTATDADGGYSLQVQDGNAVLVFSYIGFATREVTVGNQRIINITLVEDARQIDEVVVVAYGIQKKVSVTGAVSSAVTSDLKISASTNIANALSGRISGLTSTQGSGQPGRDDATLYLRGVATINGANPLILIDGVPRDNIRTIDPNEVESISVLKDASATAVFGVRGANGVLMITTRRGKEGKPELTVTATQSFSGLTREPPRLHSVDYIRLRNEALANDGFSTPFIPEVIAKFENPLAELHPDDPDYQQKAAVRKYMYPDNDYYRMFIKQWSPQTVVNVNLTGGTDKVSYFMNVGYTHQGGNFNTEPEEKLGYDPSMKLDRYNFRSNVDYKATSSLSFFLNLGTYIEKVNMPGGQIYGYNQNAMIIDLLYYARALLPISSGPYTIGGFGVEPGMVLQPSYLGGENYLVRSPFEIINYQGFTNETRANLNSSVGANWDLGFITKGLSMKGMLSFDSWSKTELRGYTWHRSYSAIVNVDTDELTFGVIKSDYDRLSLSKYAHANFKINAQANVLYNRQFGLHDVGGMFLAQRDYWESGYWELPYNVLGVAGRVTYSYDSRYLGEVNLGYNGSEQFAPKKRYGFFPAFSVGWAVSNESFLQGNPVLTFLKLRASTGRVGNDRMGGSRFLYMDDITVSQSGGFLGSLAQGAYVNEGLLGNRDITWELAQKYNLGIDFHIIQDFKASFDVFKENRSQILLTRSTVPIVQGVPSSNIPKVNLGEMENRGFEAELTYSKKVLSDLSVEMRGNFGYNRNKVLKSDEVPMDETYYYRNRREGFSYGQHWGYEIDWNQDGGYWTPETLADPNRIPYAFGTPRAGDFVYKDKNGDGEIDEKDQVPIGDGIIPRISWGASASVQYKDIDVYVFFQGLGQYHGVYNRPESDGRGVYFPYQYHAWTEERWLNGDRISYPALTSTSAVNHYANSFFVMNRSFTRFKNVEIGYTLPPNLLKAIGVSKMRIYISGQNIFTWSPKFVMTHLDPETEHDLQYPLTKIFSFGTSISF